MDSHGIQVLHVADYDSGIICVPHYLVLDLLIALDALLYKHLMNRRQGQRISHHVLHFLRIVGEAATGSAQSKSGAENYGVTDLLCGLKTLLDAVGDLRGYHGLTDPLAELLKLLPVLGTADAGRIGSQKLDLALCQNPLIVELHSQVKTSLSADARHQCVGTLVAADPCHIFQCQRLHIDLICHCIICHDGRRIRVRQHHLISFFF